MSYHTVEEIEKWTDDEKLVKLKLHILEHQDIGGGTVRAICTINGLDSKRLVTTSFGKESNPVWTVQDTIVNTFFAELLEKKYQHYKSNNIIIIK